MRYKKKHLDGKWKSLISSQKKIFLQNSYKYLLYVLFNHFYFCSLTIRRRNKYLFSVRQMLVSIRIIISIKIFAFYVFFCIKEIPFLPRINKHCIISAIINIIVILFILPSRELFLIPTLLEEKFLQMLCM